MKLNDYLKNHFVNEEKAFSDAEFLQKLQKDVHVSLQTSMKKQSSFVRLQPYFAPAFAFAIFMIIVAGVFGLINFKRGEKQVAFMAPVSAAEVIANTERAMQESEKAYYRIRTNAVNYMKDRSDGSSFGISDPGSVQEYWYDFKRGYSRIEGVGWRGTTDVFIEKTHGDKIIYYSFLSDKQTKEGIYRKMTYKKGEPITLYQGSSYVGDPRFDLKNNPKQEYEKMLEEFKNDKTTLTTVKQNGKDYHALILTFPYKNNPEEIQLTKYTLLIEAETYRPYKEIKVYDEGKATKEKTFEVVSTNVDDSVFEPTAPKGYTLMQNGKLDIVGVNDPHLVSCDSKILNLTNKENMPMICPPGVVGVYEIFNVEWTNGKSRLDYVSHGFPGLFGGVLARTDVDYDIRLYKSKEQFDSIEEAKKAKNIQFVELKKTQAGFQETELPVVGKWVQFKLEVIDKKTGKKSYDIILIPEDRNIIYEVG